MTQNVSKYFSQMFTNSMKNVFYLLITEKYTYCSSLPDIHVMLAQSKIKEAAILVKIQVLHVSKVSK